MKKLLLALTALIVAASMTVAVFAEDEKPTLTDIYNAPFYDSCGENANSSGQTDSFGGSNAYGLKPLDGVNAEGAWFEFNITVPADCVRIDFNVSYAASGERFMELTFNDETRRVTCPDTGAWSTYSTVTETFESIKKGDYVLRLAAPADFDGETVKTPNFDLIEIGFYYESYESLPETEPPETKAPETEAPATTAAPAVTEAPTTSAPEVSDGAGEQSNTTTESSSCGSSVSGVYAVIACAAACVLFRKRK